MSRKLLTGLVAFLFIAGIVVVCSVYQCGSRVEKAWALGAAAIGLVSGFTTGASKQTGAGTEFLKFISAGILTPLLGGVVALLQFRQETRETYAYEGDRVILKSTEIVLPPETSQIHPLWALGAFFTGYGLCAILGMLIGIGFRKAGFEINASA